MSFDKGRHAATSDRPTLNGDRRTFLDTLKETVDRKPRLTSGMVFDRGTPVLRVSRTRGPRRSVKIGSDYTEGDWWFCWPDGQTIEPVDDPDGVADVIAVYLGVQAPPS